MELAHDRRALELGETHVPIRAQVDRAGPPPSRARLMRLPGKHHQARFVRLELDRIAEGRDGAGEWIPKLGLEPGYTKSNLRAHALVAGVGHKVDVAGVQLAMDKA